jgi:hypothetical protein
LYTLGANNRNANTHEDDWNTEHLYLKSQPLHVKVFNILTEHIVWLNTVKRIPPCSPLEYERQQVLNGTWNEAFLSFNKFPKVSDTYFPADFELPMYSLAPYLSVSRNIDALPMHIL